jgi:hypothetical protein
MKRLAFLVLMGFALRSALRRTSPRALLSEAGTPEAWPQD